MNQNKDHADKLLYAFANAYCAMNNAGRQEAKYAATPAVEAAKQAVIDHFGGAVAGCALRPKRFILDTNGLSYEQIAAISAEYRIETHIVSCIINAAIEAAPLPDQSGATVRGEAVAREYFYKVDACKAEDGKSPECICWHKEGTGPLASRSHEVKNWRPVSARAADAPSEPSEVKTYEDGRIDGERLGRAVIDIHNSQMASNCHYRERVFNEIIALDAAEGLSRFARVKSRAADALDSQPSTDEPTDREALIACLGDAAATLSRANPDDEMAQTMREAAAMLENDGKALDSQPTDGGVRNASDLKAVHAFLMGESPLEGVQFGDKHPTKAGVHWWRLNLRAALSKG